MKKSYWVGGAVILLTGVLVAIILAHAAPKAPLVKRALPEGSLIVDDRFVETDGVEPEALSHPLSPALLASLPLSTTAVQALTAYRGYNELVTVQPEAATVLSEYTYLYADEGAAKAAEEAIGTLFARLSATALPDGASVGRAFRQEGKEGTVYWLVLRKGDRVGLLLFDGLEEEDVRQLYEATLLKLQD